MTVLLNSEIFILTLVIGVYLAAVWLFRKTRLSILNPLLVSIPVLADHSFPGDFLRVV